MNQPSTGKQKKKYLSWLLWAALSSAAALTMAFRMTDPSAPRDVFLPGTTTVGHYQIELECEVCHTESFTNTADFQVACVKCHGEELEEAQDSHPESKFTDPRNADRVEKLDARYCVTCHSEHQPNRTGSMGLSLPADYCYHCHQDIADERESHAGLAFDSCASSGCHNFHDNRALYEDYLVRHADEAVLSAQPLRPVKKGQQTCPAAARVNLTDSTSIEECRDCHQRETKSWLQGRHGMRVAQELAPMEISQARLPMKKTAAGDLMTCAACHSYGEGSAGPLGGEVEVCLGCHDDQHSRRYKKSKHFQYLLDEVAGRIAAGSGATCATCHLPRSEDEEGNLWVDHNQNHNLRPNEKMIRSVCTNCHGVPFSIDALADAELVQDNFSTGPDSHVLSVDFAVARQ